MRRAILVGIALLLAACGEGVIVGGEVTLPEATTTTSPPLVTTTTVPDQATTTVPGTTVPGSEDTTTTTTAPTPASPEKREVTVFLIADGGGTAGRAGPFLIPVAREIEPTVGVARAAMNELIGGPQGAEIPAGIHSALPENTILLGLTIDDGLATVDLSREFESGGGSFSMMARLAQVVYTLTHFDTVDRVVFHLDGRPVTVFGSEGLVLNGPVVRDDYLDLVPTIMVESPAWGAQVRSPLRITGTAAVFEATFWAELTDASGRVLARPDYVMTTEGQGWGEFDFTLSFDAGGAQELFLRVWTHSAEDGSEQGLRVHRLTVAR